MIYVRSFLYSLMAAITVISLVPWSLGAMVYAQATTQTTMRIANIDVTQFPQLRVMISGTNWPAALDTLPLQLTMDENALLPIDDRTIQQGIQLALAVDTNYLSMQGESGQSSYLEFTGTLLDLVNANVFVRDQDWLAAYLLRGSNAPQLVQEWTQEPNLIYNSVVTNRPPDVTNETLSVESLRALIAAMGDGPGAATMPKVILLFSTGTNLPDSAELVALAQREHVAIHVVELLNPSSGTDGATLRTLAEQSGGHHTILTDPSLSSVVEDALQTAHTVRILQTRADAATPQSLTAMMTLPDGTTLRATADTSLFADLLLEPVAVTLETPTGEINANTLAATAGDAGTRLLPIRATFAWVDNYPRFLKQVTYTLRGPGTLVQQEIRTEGPFDRANLALTNPVAGEYSLEVMALDELGLATNFTAPPFRLSNMPVVNESTANESAIPVATDTPAENLTINTTEAEIGQSQVAQAETAPERSSTESSVSTTVAERTDAENTDAAPLPNGAAAPAQSANTDGQPPAQIVIPGLQIGIPRSVLVASLPILLLLIAYLVYSERRERRRETTATTGSEHALSWPSSGVDQNFDLGKDDQLSPASRYTLDTMASNPTQPSVQGRGGSSMRSNPLPTSSPEVPNTPALAPFDSPAEQPASQATQHNDPIGQRGDAVVWDDEDDLEDELTVAPPSMEDEEATYRVQDVERPLVGYLVRTTSDPNLPKELPIYGLNPAPGELRQIHIGRHSKHNTVVINDKSISREHAVLVQRNGRLYLRDNASTAGTFLNWKRLNPGEELLLRHNDLIGFGQITYEFRVHGEDEATIANG